MIAIYIILGILTFLFLLLVCPIRLLIKYSEDEVKFNIKYLFLNFQILPEKPKKEKKPKKEIEEKQTEEKKQPKKDNAIFKFYKRHKLKGSIKIIKIIINIIKDFIKSVIKHITLNKANIYIGYVGEDAADTAVKVGIISSASYPLFAVLVARCKKLKEYYFKVEPLFIAEKSTIYLDTKIKIKPIFILLPSVKALFRILKFMIKLKKSDVKKTTSNEKNTKKVTA